MDGNCETHKRPHNSRRLDKRENRRKSRPGYSKAARDARIPEGKRKVAVEGLWGEGPSRESGLP
jgi:hypothetical protein